METDSLFALSFEELMLVKRRSARSTIKDLFRKSHTEDMAYHANVPMLVF